MIDYRKEVLKAEPAAQIQSMRIRKADTFEVVTYFRIVGISSEKARAAASSMRVARSEREAWQSAWTAIKGACDTGMDA
jgi:hypothetical protein